MAINNINIGAAPNDGTGDVIRDAFETVNENFQDVIGGFAGTRQIVVSATSVTSDLFVSNSYVYATTYANANTIVSRGNTTVGSNLFVQSNGATIIGNVNIVGNLTVTGTQTTGVQQATTAAILNIHYADPPPLLADDSKDLGLTFKYYKGSEVQTFLGWQNSTGSLVWMDSVTESIANVITAGTFGNVKFGQLSLSNTNAATSNVTGALTVAGGVGVQGNLFVQSNVFVGNNANVANLTVRGFHVGSLNFSGSDTIFINGSPVVTSATSFAGGAVSLATQFNATDAATSTTTGAVTIAGGLGVAGNVFVPNLTVTTGGNIRANIIGNIITNAQPFITSVGTLTGLTLNGTLSSYDIFPATTTTYNLGAGSSNRWNKLWVFDVDMSGSFVGGTVESTTLRATSSTQAISTNSGALRVTGGASINTGNLYIGGSGGDAIVATGNINLTGNIIPGANITYDLGTPTLRWRDLYLSGSTIFLGGANLTTDGSNVVITNPQGGSFAITGTPSTSQLVSNVVNANTVITNAISVQGNVTSTGDISAGNLIATSNINTSNITTGNISTGNASVSGNLTITGAAFSATPLVTDDSTRLATTAYVRDILPTGVIVMWSGSIVSIPSGWLLCDGTNGTPDLRDRFIVGAGSLYSVAGTGGSKDAIVVAHTHTAATSAEGSHNHAQGYSQGGSIAPRYGLQTGLTSQPYADASGAALSTTSAANTSTEGSHTHSVTVDSTGASGTNANLPPYFALAFIMKA